MTPTEIPEKVHLKCPHCGHEWLEATAVILGSKTTIYKSADPTVRRRVTCPNCGRGVTVDVPTAWLGH